jgi:hypothetical protein
MGAPSGSDRHTAAGTGSELQVRGAGNRSVPLAAGRYRCPPLANH